MKEIQNLILATGHPHFYHRASPWVGQRKGYFEEEGIRNYKIICTGQDENTLDGLKKGTIHFGLDVRPAIVLQENNKGVELYIIGAFINDFSFTLVANKSIKSAEDLKGKRIETVGSGGGIDERQTRMYLRKNGLDPDKDVNWIRNAGFPNASKILPRIENNQIEARAIFTEDVPIARKKGLSILCDFMAEYYPDGYLHRAIVTSGEMIREQPALVKALLKVIVRGYRFLRKEQNYAEANEIVTKATDKEGLGWDEMDYSKIEKQYLGYRVLPRTGNITKVGLQQMIDEEKNDGKLPKTYSIEKVVRLSFVEEATKELDAKYGPDGYEK